MSSRFGRERVQGFLHADGTRIVNGNGEEIILEGYGVGNWLNQEGFMIGGPAQRLNRMAKGIAESDTGIGTKRTTSMPLRFDRHRTVEQAVRELCGEKYLKTFWKRWYANHLGEADIRAMAELDLNSVRLVLNASVFLKEEPEIEWDEDGFRILEEVLDWCEKYRIYAILDMHGAPGGQSGCMFDDGFDSMPRMFYCEEFRERSILLWAEIAKRFGSREILGGYDLLNEPLSIPDERSIIPELNRFYDDCIREVRKYDKKHMFFLEGACFARNIRTFDHDYDPECHNWAIHLHKYDFSPEIKDLYPYLLKSEELQVPVWIGEGGSAPGANAVFYSTAAQFGIGYALWCWKTALNPVAPDGKGLIHHILPDRWPLISNYFIGGSRPGYKECIEIFDEYLENMKYENCIKDFGHINITRRKVPFSLAAVAYVHDPVNNRSFSSPWGLGNYLNYRLEDHTRLVWDNHYPVPLYWMDSFRMEAPHDPLEKLLLELHPGEFAEYEIREAPENTVLQLEGRSPEGAAVDLFMDGVKIGRFSIVACSEDRLTPEQIAIPVCGEKRFRLTAAEGTVQLKKLHFRKE